MQALAISRSRHLANSPTRQLAVSVGHAYADAFAN
jgi:hypothetical protein